MHSNYFMYAAPTNGIHTNAIPNVSNTNLKQQTRTVTQQSVTITNNTTGNRINAMSQALVQNAGNVHQNNHNAAQSNAHVCQICCQVFQKASSLKRHMRVHSTSSTNDSDNSPYKCNACKIDYHNAIAFEEHIKTEHGQPQAFKCVDCGCFRTVQLMTSQPFRCEGCAQQKSEPYEPIGSVSYRITSCNSSSNSQQIHVNHVKANKIDPMDLLIQTMRTGNEINGRRRKLHQCPECNKCYKHQSTLAMHKKIHTGEYKYKCQYCQKEFYLAEYYNRHMRVHTKEKPYQCDVCDKAFSQSNTLIQHKRIHSGFKFLCLIIQSECDL